MQPPDAKYIKLHNIKQAQLRTKRDRAVCHNNRHAHLRHFAGKFRECGECSVYEELFDFVVIPTKFKNFACVAVEKDVSFRRLTGNGFRRTQDKRK